MNIIKAALLLFYLPITGCLSLYYTFVPVDWKDLRDLPDGRVLYLGTKKNWSNHKIEVNIKLEREIKGGYLPYPYKGKQDG